MPVPVPVPVQFLASSRVSFLLENQRAPMRSSNINNRDMKIMEERGGSAEAVTILAGGTWDRSNQHLTGYRSVQLVKLSVHFFERIDRS